MNVILIDARNALYRFGFSHRGLQSSDGVKTGALYGLLMCLLRLKKKYPQSWFVLVWDGAGKSWRHELFPGYKANRPITKTPEAQAVIEQIPIVKEVATALGITQVEVPKLEADDLIGLLATRCYFKNWRNIIYSSDKDFMQLMTWCTLIRDVDKQNKLAPETSRTVYKRFGCHTGDVLRVRALCGDPSDGIPNVKRGMGEKTAVKYITAGIDPSQPDIDYHDDSTFTLELEHYVEDLRTVWDAVFRNYQLMRLITYTDDKRLRGTIEKKTLSRYIAHTIAAIETPGKRNKDAFRAAIEKLAALNMEEAIVSRHELWHLQYRYRE